eukprot:gene12895-biopygen11024
MDSNRPSPAKPCSRQGGRWRTATRKKLRRHGRVGTLLQSEKLRRHGTECASKPESPNEPPPRNCDGTACMMLRLSSAGTATARHACRPPAATLAPG